jgi:hypothetical protein
MVSKKVNNTGDPLFNEIINLVFGHKLTKIKDLRLAVEKYVDSRIDKKIEAMFIKSELKETKIEREAVTCPNCGMGVCSGENIGDYYNV